MRHQIRQNTEVDTVLSLQFLVAWAGEAQGRLGWWESDLVDEEGGGHLLARLAPRTHAWAALQCVRRVAFLADARARQQLPDADSVRTLFFWGFEFDERLEDRILQWKRSQTPPQEAFKWPFALEWKREEFEGYLHGLLAAPQLAGREVVEPMPARRSQAAATLARALLPLGTEYLAPYYRVKV